MSDRTQPGLFPVQCEGRTANSLKGWRPVVLAFFVFAAAGAQAEPMDVYRGTLGGSAVVLELGKPGADGERQGRYFYLRHGVDIPLQGKLEALSEARPLDNDWARENGGEPPVLTDAQQRRIVWQLRQQGSALMGDWVDGIHGKKLPLALTHIAQYDPEKIAPSGVEAVTLAIVQGAGSGISSGVVISAKSTPYDYLKVAEQKLELGKEVVSSPTLAWRPVRDARSQFWYPRLTRHPDAKILAQTNAVLEQRHWGMTLEALGCVGSIYLNAGPEAGSLGNMNEEEVTVSYLSTALMSVVVSGSNGCGGAHPNNHYNPFVLDLLRGGYLDFTRLFKGAKYGDYKLQLSPKMDTLIQKTTSHDDKDCIDYLPEFQVPMFSRPDKLSFVISGIGHAMGVCLGSGVDIRFKDLKPFIKPGAEAYFKP